MKRILLGLGCTIYSDNAIAQAVALARTKQAKITAVTVIDTERLSQVGPVPLGGGAAADELRAHRLERSRTCAAELAEKFRVACAAAGVSGEHVSLEGDIYEVLPALARYHDLLVCGLHSSFDFGVLGEAQQSSQDLLLPLIRAGVRPVVAVPAAVMPVRRVVIAYGGSLGAARTMHQYAQLNLWPEAEVHLLGMGDDEAGVRALLEDARSYLNDYGLEATIHVVPGPAKTQIMPQVEAIGAQVLVLGNSSRQLLISRIFGDTAAMALQQTEVGLFLSQ